MKFLLKVTFVFLLTAFASAANAQTAAPAAWTPELQMKVKTLGAPRVSPDGKRVAYTVANEMMTADKSEFVMQIFLSDTDGSQVATRRGNAGQTSLLPCHRLTSPS